DPVDHTDTTGLACDLDLGCDAAAQRALQDTADQVGTLIAEHPGETQQVVGAGLTMIPTPPTEAAGEALEGTGTLTRALDGEDAAAESQAASEEGSGRAGQIENHHIVPKADERAAAARDNMLRKGINPRTDKS